MFAAQVQALYDRPQVEIERLQGVQVSQICSYFRGPGRLERPFQQREMIAPTLICPVSGFLFQQFVQLGALRRAEAIVDDFIERALVLMEGCDDHIRHASTL